MNPAYSGDTNANAPPYNPTGMPGAPGVPLPPLGVPPTFYPMQPPLPNMPPMFGNMPAQNASLLPNAPMQPMYPSGQGPLADLPTKRGPNGLLQAPEQEGPDPHDALDFVKLNPGETVKYLEYWSQASDGAETVSGAHAVAFLSRASKVSKGQLRRIWDVADHRKEGHLDQSQFFVALRLVALAQRGAELSTAGLRNFTGIQLIPAIDPPPKPESPVPTPPPSSDGMRSIAMPESEAGLHANANTFSWTISQQVADRFDKFFESLAPNGEHNLTATTAVQFLTKSGLPRPTLKKIWQLADVNRDGLLSHHEFRIAMHLVTAIRNKRVVVEHLPDVLDSSGPNWLRITGVPDANIPPTLSAPPGGEPIPMQPHGTSPTVSHTQQGETGSPIIPMPPPLSQQPEDEQQTPIVLAPPPPPPPPTETATTGYVGSQTESPSVIPMTAPLQMPMQTQSQLANLEAEREERERMLGAMRKEREEMDRARREMEAMRSEMERLRMENANLSSTRTESALPVGVVNATQRVESHAHQPPPVPSSHAHHPAIPPATSLMGGGVAEARPTAAALAPTMTMGGLPGSGIAHTTNAAASSETGVPAMLAKRLGLPTTGVAPSEPQAVAITSATDTGERENKAINLGMDDDDLWDEPSPKASALPGAVRKTAGAGIVADGQGGSDSSSDDDDFWGGLGPKPTLGAAGSRQADASASTGSALGGNKAFGGSELDDWTF